MISGPGVYATHLQRERSVIDDPRDVMAMNEVAEYLRVSMSTARTLAQEGKTLDQEAGRHLRFHRVVVENWLGYRLGQQEGV